MAIPILKLWKNYFTVDRNEGLGSSYERIVLNLKLSELVETYSIKKGLEVPIFGFTGLTGINSMGLAKQGVEMTLIDDDEERLQLVRRVWQEVNLDVELIHQKKFEKLNFDDNAFDFAWNFSAMWFLQDMDEFLKELTRVVSKVIMICVPNRAGVGYLSQKYISGADLRDLLNEDFIIPKNIIKSMDKLGWQLVDRDYIDCPPWPDIGMAKEDFLKIFGLGFLAKKQEDVPFWSIMDFYADKDPEFDEKMIKLMWAENMMPKFMKAGWAHHRYLIFVEK